MDEHRNGLSFCVSTPDHTHKIGLPIFVWDGKALVLECYDKSLLVKINLTTFRPPKGFYYRGTKNSQIYLLYFYFLKRTNISPYFIYNFIYCTIKIRLVLVYCVSGIFFINKLYVISKHQTI